MEMHVAVFISKMIEQCFSLGTSERATADAVWAVS
jgi:hypothetical protein